MSAGTARLCAGRSVCAGLLDHGRGSSSALLPPRAPNLLRNLQDDGAVTATVELREITKDSLAAVLDLAVEPEQEQYVATNARSIAEAHFEPHAWFRAS